MTIDLLIVGAGICLIGLVAVIYAVLAAGHTDEDQT